MSWFDTALAGYYRAVEQQRALNAQGVEQAAGAISQGLSHGLGQMRQNQIADQVSQSLANTGAYAPRAGLVSPGTNPITKSLNTIAAGTPTTESWPASYTGGGMLGLELRNKLTSQSKENALKTAQIGSFGAHGAAALQGAATMEGYRAAEEARLKAQTDALNSGRDPASIAAQRQEEVDYRQQVREAEAHADTMEKLKGDVESVHPGAFKQFGAVLSSGNRKGLFQGDFDKDGNWQGDPNGSLITADPSAGTGHPTAAQITAMTPNEFEYFAGRAKNITSSPSGRYVAPVARRAQAPGPAPAQAQGGGNIPTFQTPDQAKASGLPSGSPFKNPQGQVLYMP
jgi:hypothetical protein